MELPVKKSGINKKWEDQTIGIVGSAGIGKSGLFEHAPNCLYIQTEAGLNHLDVIKEPITTWDQYCKLEGALIKAYLDGKFPYKTIVIDTIDRFVDLANEDVCAFNREKFKNIHIETLGDIPMGGAWANATKKIMGAMHKLEKLPACIAFIGHPDFKDVTEDGVTIKKHTISIGGQTGKRLSHWPDHFLNMQSKMVGNEIKRKFCTIPTNSMEAKSRGGMVPNNWLLTADAKENWEKFRALFS